MSSNSIFSGQFIRLIIIFAISSLGPFVLNNLVAINAYFRLKYSCINKVCCNNALILQPTPGFIGNQMFQYATLYAHAKRHRLTPLYVKGGWMKIQIFSMFRNLSIKEATCDTDNNKVIKSIGSPACCSYNKGLEEIGQHWPNYKISGFFQSWRHFDFARPWLLKEFEMKPEFENKALDFINSTTGNLGLDLAIRCIAWHYPRINVINSALNEVFITWAISMFLFENKICSSNMNSDVNCQIQA